jgi:hypothetical protein
MWAILVLYLATGAAFIRRSFMEHGLNQRLSTMATGHGIGYLVTVFNK